jgi:YVTN family beta-propeller protein
VTNWNSGTVSVIDTTTNTVVGTVFAVGLSPGELVVHPNGTRIYVANYWSGTVSVIDTATDTLVGMPIAVGTNPRSVAVSPDGTRVYVVNENSGTISVINTATNTATGVPIVMGNDPIGIAIANIPPGSPTIGTATAGNAQVTATFTAPATNGGSPITSYTATCGALTVTGATSPLTVMGLINGTSVTCTVTATNAAGTSAPSAASNSVAPSAPVTTFTVSASAGTNGSITPAAQTVAQGNTTSFTVTPNAGYTASASGCGGSLAGSTYTTGAITADCTVSATFSQNATATQTSLVTGWNLLGNSINAPLDVAIAFGDTTKVQTVWKWVPSGNTPGLTYPTWAFYAPSLTAPNLATYTASKNYEVLSSVNGGEGFWVNAKAAFAAQLPAGAAIGTGYFQNQLDPAQNKLLRGWNLIATGDAVTPSAFNLALSLTPPAQGVIPLNLTTLWAWDSALMSWYFYAPSLETSGGLLNYITGKNYLDFIQHNKTLGQGVGFWVNRP